MVYGAYSLGNGVGSPSLSSVRTHSLIVRETIAQSTIMFRFIRIGTIITMWSRRLAQRTEAGTLLPPEGAVIFFLSADRELFVRLGIASC